MRYDTGDLRYDCAVAAAALILNLFDSSPGGSKPELMSQATFVVLEAIKRYETEAKPHAFYRESVN
jgi:hypothetical protein